jgi:hypothetical protein
MKGPTPAQQAKSQVAYERSPYTKREEWIAECERMQAEYEASAQYRWDQRKQKWNAYAARGLWRVLFLIYGLVSWPFVICGLGGDVDE